MSEAPSVPEPGLGARSGQSQPNPGPGFDHGRALLWTMEGISLMPASEGKKSIDVIKEAKQKIKPEVFRRA